MSFNPDGVNPQLLSAAQWIVANSGGQIGLGSGYRTPEEQAVLYQAYLNGQGNLAAPPGKSKHNHGLAIDFDTDNYELLHQLAAQVGLIFPVDGEPWHAELGEGAHNMDMGQYGSGSIQYDLNYLGTEGASPEDVLANRLHSILRITSLDPVMGGSPGVVMGGPDMGMGQDMPNPLDTGVGVDMAQDMLQGWGPTEVGQGGIPDFLNPGAGLQGGGMQGGMGGPIGPGLEGVSDPNGYAAYALSLFPQFGWGPEQLPYLIALGNEESGDGQSTMDKVLWNPNADNPYSTAYGIGQFLDSTWAGTGIAKTNDPRQQILAMLIYIKNRPQYGSPQAALDFHHRNNYY